MSGPLHKDLRGANIHVIHAWEYLDESEREEDSGFSSEDIGRVCFVKDTGKFYVLVNNDPATWSLLGVAGSTGSFYAVSSTGSTIKIDVSNGIIVGIGT